MTDAPSALDELWRFLERMLGWGDQRAVDRALQLVELAITQHAPLVLCGDREGDLVLLAHALYRRMLGPGRPFVLARRGARRSR